MRDIHAVATNPRARALCPNGNNAVNATQSALQGDVAVSGVKDADRRQNGLCGLLSGFTGHVVSGGWHE